MKNRRLYLLLAVPILLAGALALPLRHYMIAHSVSVAVSRVVPRTPPAPLNVSGPSILVDKTDHKLYLYDRKKLVKTYQVALGPAPENKDKEIEGDGATPEGKFFICQKAFPSVSFLGTRWMRLSYPDREDANRGLSRRLIKQDEFEQIVEAQRNTETPPQKTKLGGGIGIHGGGFSSLGRPVLDWTAGCIGLVDRDAEELYASVKVGTPVVIRK